LTDRGDERSSIGASIQPTIAMDHADPTMTLAMTIAERDVGEATRSRTVRSANSRPKSQANRNANRIAPPIATACEISPTNVGQSAVPAARPPLSVLG
jgi:hypothetical protein